MAPDKRDLKFDEWRDSRGARLNRLNCLSNYADSRHEENFSNKSPINQRPLRLLQTVAAALSLWKQNYTHGEQQMCCIL
jgi:hypothetical protein